MTCILENVVEKYLILAKTKFNHEAEFNHTSLANENRPV